MRAKVAFAMAAVLLAMPAIAADTLKVDRSHSHVGFEVRHLISTVTGSFNDFDGTIQFNRADPTQSSVEFTIQSASIDTGAENRDKHLRSPDFFDAEKHPLITFKSKRIAKKSGDSYDVTGDFTMHGVTKEITVPVRYLGMAKGGRGREIAGFKATVTLNRKDYGIIWNRSLDAGEVLLGDDVAVNINLEAGAPPPPEKPADKPAEKPAEQKKQ